MAANHSHPIYAAIAKLLKDASSNYEGENLKLEVFIDMGRGDLYIESPTGARICVEAESVIHSTGDWVYGERTEIPEATIPGFNHATKTYNSVEEAIHAAQDAIVAQQLAGDDSFYVVMSSPNLHGLIATVGTTENREIFAIHTCGGEYTFDSIP